MKILYPLKICHNQNFLFSQAHFAHKHDKKQNKQNTVKTHVKYIVKNDII